jgi:hypothetical protein
MLNVLSLQKLTMDAGSQNDPSNPTPDSTSSNMGCLCSTTSNALCFAPMGPAPF